MGSRSGKGVRPVREDCIDGAAGSCEVKLQIQENQVHVFSHSSSPIANFLPSSQVSDLVADISGQRHLATTSGRNVSILLHEPGFSCILPVLLRMTARPMPIAPDGSTLVVDCVTVDKLQVLCHVMVYA